MKKPLICLALAFCLKIDLVAGMRTLAVLPFANLSKNPSVRWISETFPELLEDRLRWPGLNVLGREDRLTAFERIGIPYSNVLSKASLIKVGQELDSTLLIWGDFSLEGSKLKVSASVLDLPNSALSAELKEEGELVDLQTSCSRLAWQILKSLDSSPLPPREAFVARFPVIPNIALENYVRGLLEADRSKQIRFFRQADKAYPNFVKAIFQLGRIYYQEKDYSTSSLWLQRVTRLDKDSSEARFLLGLNYLLMKNYEKATLEFQQLTQIVPLSEVYSNLAVALSLQGRSEEATTAFHKALEGEPSGNDYLFNQAYHSWRTGNFVSAAKDLKEVLSRDEGDAEAHYLLYKCLQALGRTAEADTSWSLAKQLNAKFESWESRKQIPDLFRIQSNFDEVRLRRLQLEIQALHDDKS
jgi:tetratricopeptide (TPR) repeat protein